MPAMNGTMGIVSTCPKRKPNTSSSTSQRCKEEDPSLQTVFRLVPAQVAPPNPEEKKKKPKEKGASKSDKRCGQCEGCKTPSCGHCDACLGYQDGVRKQRCEMRICTNTVSRKKDRELKAASRTKKRRRSLSPEVLVNPALEGDRQCYGPECIMTARSQSKFCSDSCGMKLATNRIYRVLPQRIQEWSLSLAICEEQNKKALEAIRTKQTIVRATLAELDKRHADKTK